jgi:hypothetical protein
MTSQSMMIVRSPRTSRSVTARSDRPIRRWISWVLPEIRPGILSRWLRVSVERGSMAYSAVTQPVPWPLRKGGALASMLAAAATRVRPISIKAEPSA